MTEQATHPLDPRDEPSTPETVAILWPGYERAWRCHRCRLVYVSATLHSENCPERKPYPLGLNAFDLTMPPEFFAFGRSVSDEAPALLSSLPADLTRVFGVEVEKYLVSFFGTIENAKASARLYVLEERPSPIEVEVGEDGVLRATHTWRLRRKSEDELRAEAEL